MSSDRLAACIIAALVLATLCPAARAEEPINIENWPDDVPCDKLKKNADGSYEMTVPWTRFFQVHSGGKWKNTRETHYWDEKCKGKTQ
jgi:hypothetical protein